MLNLVNDSQLDAALVPSWDQQGKRQFTLVIKADYYFNLNGQLWLSSAKPELVRADQWRGKPRLSSLTSADETVPFKQGAEYYLFGSASPPTDNKAMRISLGLQSSDQHQHKALRLLGEHQWQSSLLGPVRGQPQPLATQIPLGYELAYGGIDEKSGMECSSNPAGRGFNPARFSLRDRRAPLIEYDQHKLASSPRQNLPPAGFGPLPALWSPRRNRAKYSSAGPHQDQGCPWSAAAANMHNYAPDDQQWPHPFEGGEKLILEGFFVGHNAPVELELPQTALSAQLIESDRTQQLALQCDTLVINTDQRQLSLVWRCALPWYSPLAPQPVTLWLPGTLLRNDSDVEHSD